MNESGNVSWLRTVFSYKTFKSSGYFHIKFPGLSLAYLCLTISTLIRILFLQPLVHDAVDIGKSKPVPTVKPSKIDFLDYFAIDLFQPYFV